MLMINDNDYSKYYDKSNMIKINQWIRKIIALLLTSVVKNYNNRDFKNMIITIMRMIVIIVINNNNL